MPSTAYNYTFRDAQGTDVEAMTAIFNEQVRTSPAIFTEIEVTVESRLNLLRERQAKNFPWIVAIAKNTETNEESVAGYGTYGEFRGAISGYRFTVEHSLYVHNDHRGNGLGKVMLSRLLEIAKERGIHVVVAGIDSENQLSIDLHSKAGFMEVGRMPETGFKFGKWRTVVFMQKILS
jgi:phosphinothricin acetyltransferase